MNKGWGRGEGVYLLGRWADIRPAISWQSGLRHPMCMGSSPSTALPVGPSTPDTMPCCQTKKVSFGASYHGKDFLYTCTKDTSIERSPGRSQEEDALGESALSSVANAILAATGASSGGAMRGDERWHHCVSSPPMSPHDSGHMGLQS